MTVCTNRVDGGIGPYTTGAVHVLTSCFDDTILLPIGCWIFIIAFILLIVLLGGRRRLENSYQNRQNVDHIPMSSNPEIAKTETTSGQRVKTYWNGQWRKTRIALLVISTFLIIALFAMHVLEIARLSANHQGIGLLPFCLIPLIIVLISLYLPSPAWSRKGWSVPTKPHGMAWMGLVAFWALWMTATVGVKLWTFSKVKNAIGEAAYNGKDSRYKYSDRIVDNVVICAVYFVFLLCYLYQMFLEHRRGDRGVFV